MGRDRKGNCIGALNWAGERQREKIGSASAWAQFLIIFRQCCRSWCEQTGRDRQGKCSGTLNWAGERRREKIGSTSAWARFLIIFSQRGHQQAWLVGLEWESPEAGTILFSPSFEDAMPLWMDDRHSPLGEHNLAAKVGKGAQANEGVGERGHHMSLHCCRWEGRGRGQGCTGNRLFWTAVCHSDSYGGSIWVEVSNGRVGRKVEATGAGVRNASMRGR
jgi:hypothetical protein